MLPKAVSEVKHIIPVGPHGRLSGSSSPDAHLQLPGEEHISSDPPLLAHLPLSCHFLLCRLFLSVLGKHDILAIASPAGRCQQGELVLESKIMGHTLKSQGNFKSKHQLF